MYTLTVITADSIGNPKFGMFYKSNFENDSTDKISDLEIIPLICYPPSENICVVINNVYINSDYRRLDWKSKIRNVLQKQFWEWLYR